MTNRTDSRIRSTPSPARNASNNSDATDWDNAIGGNLLVSTWRYTPRIPPMAPATATTHRTPKPHHARGLTPAAARWGRASTKSSPGGRPSGPEKLAVALDLTAGCPSSMTECESAVEIGGLQRFGEAALEGWADEAGDLIVGHCDERFALENVLTPQSPASRGSPGGPSLAASPPNRCRSADPARPLRSPRIRHRAAQSSRWGPASGRGSWEAPGCR